MKNISNPQAVEYALEKEVTTILVKENDLLKAQVKELRYCMESLLSILKHSPAESGDNEITGLLSDFRSDWPSSMS